MIKKIKLSLIRMLAFLALLIVSVISLPVSAMEVKVFAIGDFVPSSSGGCGGGDRSHWPSMIDKWYDKMGSKGHTKDGQYTNGSMTIRRFCDPDWNSGCLDYNYLDEADAAMLAMHGSDSGDHWQGTMRSPWNGECGLDAGGNADNMWAGDWDLEFIHLSSCFSADDDNLPGIREAMYDPFDSPPTGRRAHQWDGFHGIMWIGSSFDNDYKEFANDAHSIAIARSWTNNLYDGTVDCKWYDPWNVFGTCQEQCPVAYSIGTTGSDALSRLNYERYNNVYSDPGGSNWYAYRYIVNCDSVGETAFNP